MVKVKYLILFFLIFGGLLFSFTVKANSDTYDFGEFQCNSSGSKTCDTSYPIRQNDQQMWKGKVRFNWLATQGGEHANADFCISRNTTMWDADDQCFLIKHVGENAVGGVKEVTNSVYSAGYDPRWTLLDYKNIVLHIDIKGTNTGSTGTVWSRRVNVTGFDFSKTSVVIGQHFNISWSTSWADEAWLKRSLSGWSTSLVENGEQTENKSGAYNNLSELGAGSREYKVCASGPGIEPGSPEQNPGEQGEGPPFQVYLPIEKVFAAGDGTTECIAKSVTVDYGATLKTSPVDDSDNGTAEFTFNATQGGSNPANQTLTIKDNTFNADRDLQWEAAPIDYIVGQGGWLSLQSIKGNLAVNNTVDKNVSVNIAGLSAGTYKAKIKITGCSGGSGGTGGGCNANTVSDAQYARTNNPTTANPTVLNVTLNVSSSPATITVYSNVSNVTFGFGGAGGIDAGCQPLQTNGSPNHDYGSLWSWRCSNVDPAANSTWTGSYATYTLQNAQNLSSYGFDNPPQYTPSSQHLSPGQEISYTITYNYTVPTVNIKCDGQAGDCTIPYGTASTLSWTTTNATSCSASRDWSGSKATSGSQSTGSLTTVKTYHYKLTCDGPGGSANDTVDVTVSAALPACVINSFTASPNPVNYNSSSTLTWSSTNATSCAGTNGDASWPGVKATSSSQVTGLLTSSTTYNLSCTGLDGNPCVINPVTVIVNPSPTPSLSVSLVPSPSTGPAPLSSILSATVGGTATGTINYSFWWNCNDTGTSVGIVEGICGALPVPAGGSCSSNANGYKCNGMVPTSQSTTAHSYNSTSTAKVIVERDGATSATASAIVTVIPIPTSTPSASSVTVTEPDYCLSGPAATVGWTYSDPLGSPQTAYQVQVDDKGGFSDCNDGNPNTICEIDSGKVGSLLNPNGSVAFSGGMGVMQFNTTYRARVMVWNNSDTPSAWTQMSICSGPGCAGNQQSWKTPNYAYPQVNFTFSPTSPAINTPVQFTDTTTFQGPANGRSWSWNFGDAGTSNLQNPSHTYTTQGSYGVVLTATDNANQSCSSVPPQTLNIQPPIPIWKEVAPR